MEIAAAIMNKKQSCVAPHSKSSTTSSSSSSLGMHKSSQMMSKGRPPKIRIIHIFAPEIIKTDVANFRELVQRLTGKPSSQHTTVGAAKKKRQTRTINCPALAVPKKLEIRTGFRPAELRERIKGEEEIWGGANSGGGFLGGFADLDGFMQELNAFPILPLDASPMDAFADHQSQLA
ncbi:hypothetical protein DCAR_0417480 [Daucus carota subsp. sativus]|uniref:VQ domain-containing protein n=2 Tax=Daucus carota subsp. sativus TaxID=79200 RepID=A0A162AC85_DAUCS|nr:hypothetical protein DCAR_0417480 [Daucus carota subsp. sativus]